MSGGWRIVGLGEALFDVFPNRTVLGGAPLNVAVHAHQLVAPYGGEGLVASRIGGDELGQRLQAELTSRGLSTSFLQHDPELPTGRVLVELDGAEPSYEIVEDVAWDRLAYTPEMAQLAAQCQAVCFGTLGQRSPVARKTIATFLDVAEHAIRLFDVNLRQTYYTCEVLEAGCRMASVVKLNRSELLHVARISGVCTAEIEEDEEQIAERFRKHFGLDALVVTRGGEGTALYRAKDTTRGEPVSFPQAEGADRVGAGDSVCAAVIIGLLEGWSPARIVKLANTVGAYVASQPGATPPLPTELIALAKPEVKSAAPASVPAKG